MKSRKLLPVLLALLGAAASCSRDPKTLVANGNKYFERQKYKEASILYRRALQKDRKNAEAWYKLGLVDLRTGLVPDAAGALQRAVQLDPSNTDAAGKLADIYFAASMFDSAHRDQDLSEVRDIAKELLRRNPHSFDGLRLSGYVAVVENRLPDAITAFTEANRVHPDDPRVIMALCHSLATTGRKDDAEKLARELIGKNKNLPEPYDFLARLYLGENRRDAAENILKEKVANNPTNGPYMIQLARFYLYVGNQQQMTNTLNRLTSDLKKYPQAWMLVGDFYAYANAPDHLNRALDAFQHGESADPKNRIAYEKRRVETLIAANRVSEAGTLLNDILRQSPNDPEATALRAAMDIQTGQKDKVLAAIKALQPLVGKYQNVAAAPMLHLNLGRAYAIKATFDLTDPDPTRRQSDLDQARIQLEQAIQSARGGKYPVAELLLAEVQLQRGENARVVQIADSILNSDPGSIPAHLYRAQALMRMQEPEKARDELTHLLAQNPNVREARYELARLDLAQKRYGDAEAGFTKVEQSGDDRGFYGLMDAKLAEGHSAEVMNDIENRLRAQPGNHGLRLALANIQMRVHKYQDAVDGYQNVLGAVPTNNFRQRMDILLQIASAQHAMGNTDAALQTLAKARDLMPGEAQPLVETGIIYYDTGRKDQARVEYEKALKLDPENVAALNNLAYMKADEGVDLDRALTLAQRALQKQPNNPDVMDTIAFVYLRKQLTDEGLRIETELVGRNPDNSTFHYHRALALVQKGDTTTARKELATALQHNPSAVEQGKIRELMSRIG